MHSMQSIRAIHGVDGTFECSRGHATEHAGAQVRVAAMGPHAEEVSWTHDMTDVYHLIAKALGAEGLNRCRLSAARQQ